MKRELSGDSTWVALWKISLCLFTVIPDNINDTLAWLDVNCEVEANGARGYLQRNYSYKGNALKQKRIQF